jgi:hypothetical protein
MTDDSKMRLLGSNDLMLFVGAGTVTDRFRLESTSTDDVVMTLGVAR